MSIPQTLFIPPLTTSINKASLNMYSLITLIQRYLTPSTTSLSISLLTHFVMPSASQMMTLSSPQPIDVEVYQPD